MRVLVTGSRDVSDPRTDPGVRVPGPRVGSAALQRHHSRGKGRRAFSNRKRRHKFRNPHVRQEKSRRLVTEIVGLTRVYPSESASMLEG
jgi:hypothetical protein